METTLLQNCLRKYANINEEPYELPNIIESFAYDYESDLDYQCAQAYSLSELNETVMGGRWDDYELSAIVEIGPTPFYQVETCQGYYEIAAFDGTYDDFVIENIAKDLLAHCEIQYDFEALTFVFDTDEDFPVMCDEIITAVILQSLVNHAHCFHEWDLVNIVHNWKNN